MLKQKSLLTKALRQVRRLICHISLSRMLGRFIPSSLWQSLKEEIPFEAMREKIDWSHTVAYSPPLTSVAGSVNINLKGREGQGVVDSNSYSKLKEEIIKNLKALGEETSDFKIEGFKREELYHGEQLGRAPDIIYTINDFQRVSSSSFSSGRIFQPGSMGGAYSGAHRLEGIFVAKGPQIKESYSFEGTEIVDIAPTILHILGLPVPQDMNGKVLKELFQNGSELAQRGVRVSRVKKATREPEKIEDASIWKRLEDWGYLSGKQIDLLKFSYL